MWPSRRRSGWHHTGLRSCLAALRASRVHGLIYRAGAGGIPVRRMSARQTPASKSRGDSVSPGTRRPRDRAVALHRVRRNSGRLERRCRALTVGRIAPAGRTIVRVRAMPVVTRDIRCLIVLVHAGGRARLRLVCRRFGCRPFECGQLRCALHVSRWAAPVLSAGMTSSGASAGVQ